MRTPFGWMATPAPSTDLGQRRGLLVEAHIDAAEDEGGGGSDPADAAADDRDAKGIGSHGNSHRRMRLNLCPAAALPQQET
jgi:hypothetical protein